MDSVTTTAEKSQPGPSALIWSEDRPRDVNEAFMRAARAFPDRPFIDVLPETAQVYGVAAGELSYGEASIKISDLAAAFSSAGYGRSHRVGLLLENRPAFLLIWFALNSLGVSVVPINPDLRAAELEYLVAHSELCAAVVIRARQPDIEKAAQTAGRDVVIFGPDDPPVAPNRPPEPCRPAAPDDECALLYTSGTTGLPKGCLLSNDYFLVCAEWYPRAGGLCALSKGAERLLTPLPLFHMNAMATSAMGMIGCAGCLIVLDRFHPTTWWESVRRSRATIIHYLGVMPAILMSLPATDVDTDHGVRFGFGAGVSRELHAPFEARFAIPLIEAWAMTETGAGGVIACAAEPRHVGTNCFGRAPAEVEVRLVGDDGREVGADVPGELLVRRAGPDPRHGFFSGYLKDPAASHDAWAGGWFHTGDIVRRDTDGYLCFVDRRKNVIRRSGENISAVEVEAVLGRHPLVRTVAVAAAPDDLRGDEVIACVVAYPSPPDRPAREAAAADIVRWCLERLAYYKAPGYVAFVETLPLTSTQKIRRGDMKALVVEALDQPTCIDTRALKSKRGR